MVRPTKDLSIYRFQLEEWKTRDKLTDKEILHRLQSDYNATISQPTLYRNFIRWGTSLHKRTQDSPELRDRISFLFIKHVLNDHFLLLQLHSDGFIITKNGLETIRRELGLWRRQDDFKAAPQVKKLREFFETEFRRNTILKTYGRTYLYTWVRQQGHILSRRLVYDAFRDFTPESVIDRWNTMRYRRTGWTAPGPDFIWSIDAHDKLKAWGFEIYASIDAYSRYITWFYIGVSAGTSRSVAGQYLRVLSERGKMPNLVRSDRGGETILMAGIHWYLSQLRVRTRKDGQKEPITFRQCWIYGKSTSNEKIESWWLRFSRARGGQWRKYFMTLSQNGRFSNDCLPDRIALLYIYMPILREELTSFVLTWNSHYIRKQSNRPHVVPGQPVTLYHQPEAREVTSFAEVIPQDRLEELQATYNNDPYDLDAYLPDDTISVCDAWAAEYGYEENPAEEHDDNGVDSGETPRLSAYLSLRDYLQRYLDQNKTPCIGLLENPTGGLGRLKSQLENRGINVDVLTEELAAIAAEEEAF